MNFRFSQQIAFLALLIVPAFLSAQTSNGSVSGTVRDQSSAVIPNTTVALTNTATGVKSSTVTNEAGFYTFRGVIPGQYQLEVEAAGMQKYQASLTVQVQQSAVVDPVMRTGQVTTSVMVQDATPMVNTDTPTLGHVLERQRIETLPINGRDFEKLLQTVPGMEGQRAYGLREGSIDITLDGAPLEDRVRARSQLRPPSLETLQEFKVENNASSARFTRPTTVILSSRSGTNQIHGSLFETNRNNSIGKARSRQDGNGAPPHLVRNEFGGSVGGPLILPKIYDGRNRTFWFYSFEGARRMNSYTSNQAIPTDAMWNGDFSGLRDSSNRAITLYDPYTTDSKTYARLPFSYGGRTNVMDPKLISPFGKYLSGITPRPTFPDVNPLADSNWWGIAQSYNRNYTTSFRFDHRFTDKDSFYARYSRGQYTDFDSAYYGVPISDGSSNGLLTTSPNQSLAMSWVRSISPTLFNELLTSASRETYYAGNKYETDFDKALGIPNPYDSKSFPVINQVKFGTLKYQPHNMNGSFNTFYLVDDNVTKIVGKHELQFGGHFRMDFVNLLPDQQATAGQVIPSIYPTALWDPKGTLASPLAVGNTGNTFATMLLGANSYMLRLNHGMFYGRTKEYALYLQDNWRVSSRLTLNIGLRWEAWPAYREKYGNIVSYDLASKSVVLTQPMDKYYAIHGTYPGIVNRMQDLGAKFTTYDKVGQPQRLMHGNFADFGPRLGFAYKLGSSRPSVIRGGFRMSYFPIPIRTWSEYARSSIPFTAFPAWDPNDPTMSPDGYPNWTLRNAPNVITGVNSQKVIDPFSSVAGIARGNNMNANFFDPNLPDSRVSDWNLSFEKEFLSNMVAKASYIGNHVDYLDEFYNRNQPPTTYTWLATKGVPLPTGEYANLATRPFDNTVYNNVLEYGKWGWSNTNGMQLEMERRYSHGLSFQVFYVMMNAFTAGGRAQNATMYPAESYMPGIVPQDFDARNRFLFYQRDTTVPKHRLRWNWLADLPFGKGKLLGGNAGPILNRIIGGWQIAGMGSISSTYIALPSTLFANGQKLENYGYNMPVKDCRSGKCFDGYLWYNTYIPPQQINSHDSKGNPNGVMGLPDNYKPAAQPYLPWPATVTPGDPLTAYYGTNTVWVPMKDGSTLRTTYDPGDFPWRNQFIPGVRNFSMDASLFKTVPITEKVMLRLNADFFNVLNNPGNPQVNSNGIVLTRTSGNSPRELQLSLRLTW